MNFLSYFALKYVQQLEDVSKSSKYCLARLLLEREKSAERMKLENNKATDLENSELRRERH